ncbi:uncharacterized protein isoform X1 [Danio rerio]|uniref:Uncharacterized protein isoform X1 n=2 Tax=Danio rerio TaxID=7955 RepID=A0A8M2BHH5_DANRE|nr:uncharacterized protein LOC799904 isoform X1 [Danio rerio]XP_021323822.1 uncharacterized protein LOC799904 isoform X1 [Danio rerio]|eukprot:XP_005170187.1 uncharacterized protein LOC799904 isoform X1 [Danio rerio]
MMGEPVMLWLALLLGLCVTDVAPANLALGAAAVQSSTGDPNGNAEHAVDGNTEADYRKGSCTHTSREFNPWWRVDLGGVSSVNKVTITNRGDCCEERIRGAQIRIGDSLENNGNNNQLAATLLDAIKGSQTFEFQPIQGRYLNVFLPGNDETLSLCEVEVFSAGPSKNIAAGAAAIQSSTWPHDGDAGNAVDGSTESEYQEGSCSHTLGETNPWWRVDLGRVFSIRRVSITNRGDCCEERLNGAEIRIGNSLENNGNSNHLVATVEHIPAGNTETFEFQPVQGRFLNIVLPGVNVYLTLCEVQVFTD